MTKINDINTAREGSTLSSGASYVEYLYESYLLDRNSVPEEWQQYFDTLREGSSEQETLHIPIQHKFLNMAQAKKGAAVAVPADIEHERKQVAVLALIQSYRARGHHKSNLDPLALSERPAQVDLDLAYHGLTDADLDTEFTTSFFNGMKKAKLRDILRLLNNTYCGSIGVEYMHISDRDQVHWLQERLESPDFTTKLTPEMRKRVYAQLTAAEGLERYLHTKYVGQKRFSLEGGESMIPLLDELIMRACGHQVQETVIGMAHRGRLNVLVNLLGKSPKELFEEFEGVHDASKYYGSGDVKYHQGFSSDIRTDKGVMHLALAFNPSHLEIVSPVVEGSVRARQDRRHDKEHKQVLPVLLHGDAAFAGQGVVMETFNMSQARGFKVGGTVHVVINNQIGFTTSNPLDCRSTLYCTDIAKMVQAPVFHVNADDPDAVLFVTQIALDFRMKFGKDVVIDMVCYRRHGHNEADEPSGTQPLMYKKIKEHPPVRVIYAERLVKAGVMTQEEADKLPETYRTKLDAGENIVTHLVEGYVHEHVIDWSKFSQIDFKKPVKTGVDEKTLIQLAEKLVQVPEGFKLQNQVAKVYTDRLKMAHSELLFDWGFAETLAYATLIEEGYGVRLTGQDAGRGTFSHRHAALHHQETDEVYLPLEKLGKPKQFVVIDSLLSEEAVLGFEYGYSSTEPRSLVIWEAQFGDFANGAQVVIDQFISSGELKWGRFVGLVMLLPHGYEGMGPEHSSARLERYLQLCAEHNMYVCTPTTPAQVFHMLRRQMHQTFRKPLIVMSPKSLLRHRLATSSKEELVHGEFQHMIGEIDDLNDNDITRVVICNGKVYYDLLQKRRDEKINHIAIIRIEQLYPFPEDALRETLAKYTNAKEVIWCQEEPKNQGAWYCTAHHLTAALAAHQTLNYAGRDSSASPAAGYYGLHVEQQAKLVADALALAQ